jgi:hypothetical protein
MPNNLRYHVTLLLDPQLGWWRLRTFELTLDHTKYYLEWGSISHEVDLRLRPFSSLLAHTYAWRY